LETLSKWIIRKEAEIEKTTNKFSNSQKNKWDRAGRNLEV